MFFQRRWLLGSILVSSVLLQACDVRQAQVKLAPLMPDAVLLAFGDSLTYGTGASVADSYPEVLASLINYEVINAGVPGETSAQGLARLPTTLDKIKPDLLILIHGGNDYLRRYSESVLKKNLSQMISLAKSRSIPVVMMSVPKPAIFLKPATVYGELADQYNLPLDNSTLSEVLADSSLKSDQVHPNGLGYRVIAEKLKTLLMSSGAI